MTGCKVISAERTRFTELRRRLLELHPDLDEQTLADTLEGATDFKEALAALIRSALEDECLAKALKDRLDQMKGRLSRLEARASSKRQVAVENMEAADLRKLQEPDFTASVRIGPPSVTIVSEDELPIDYLMPQPPKPDKRAILEALSGGAFVPGAVLSNPKISLSVRSQ
jgi:hypothetical protein